MDHNLNFFVNGKNLNFVNSRQLILFLKWKTSIFLLMEDDLNNFLNVRQPHFLTDGRWSQSKQVEVGKPSLASPRLTWAWHSSAPACFNIFNILLFLIDISINFEIISHLSVSALKKTTCPNVSMLSSQPLPPGACLIGYSLSLELK